MDRRLHRLEAVGCSTEGCPGTVWPTTSSEDGRQGGSSRNSHRVWYRIGAEMASDALPPLHGLVEAAGYAAGRAAILTVSPLEGRRLNLIDLDSLARLPQAPALGPAGRLSTDDALMLTSEYAGVLSGGGGALLHIQDPVETVYRLQLESPPLSQVFSRNQWWALHRRDGVLYAETVNLLDGNISRLELGAGLGPLCRPVGLPDGMLLVGRDGAVVRASPDGTQQLRVDLPTQATIDGAAATTGGIALLIRAAEQIYIDFWNAESGDTVSRTMIPGARNWLEGPACSARFVAYHDSRTAFAVDRATGAVLSHTVPAAAEIVHLALVSHPAAERVLLRVRLAGADRWEIWSPEKGETEEAAGAMPCDTVAAITDSGILMITPERGGENSEVQLWQLK